MAKSLKSEKIEVKNHYFENAAQIYIKFLNSELLSNTIKNQEQELADHENLIQILEVEVEHLFKKTIDQILGLKRLAQNRVKKNDFS